MNKLYIGIAVLAMGAIGFSCIKTETTPSFPKSDGSFAATPSATTVAAPSSDSLNNVLTFNWNDPKFAVGLSKTMFTIVVDSTGSNFKKFTTKSFTGGTSGALLGKELNKMALQAGGSVGQPISLGMKVIASLGNGGESKESSVATITVTPYGDLAIWTSSRAVVCTGATADKTGDTLTWSAAFKGFNGFVSYQLQYAKGGTNFANPVSVSVTKLMKIFTKLDLNKIAIAAGINPPGVGDVDFRIMASNSANETQYSNTVTVNITTYAAYNSIGIIGDATAGSWGTDTDMRRPDAVNNPANWTGVFYLTGGKSAKFRADDDWATNWGDTAFPTGTGQQNGNNIPISTTGYYQVDFNSGSGVYTFTLLSPTTYTNISLIGDFNGWSADNDLTADASGHIWTGTLSLSLGSSGLKFRADHQWTTAWGVGSNGGTVPSGYSSTSGGNMTVPQGNYFVYFNDLTGEYFFGSTDNNPNAGSPTAYTQIGAIGDFNGWSTDVFLTQDPTNPFKWSGKIPFDFGSNTSGGVKFRANAGWTTSWGGSTFPGGQGTTNGDPNITVSKGTYQITFNTATGEYYFWN